MSRVVNALQGVHDHIGDTIEDHSRRRSAVSVHCSEFIADLEELTQISHNLSYADEIVRLSSEIISLPVVNCTFDHIQSLHGHRDTIMRHILRHLGLLGSSTFSSTSKLNVDLNDSKKDLEISAL